MIALYRFVRTVLHQAFINQNWIAATVTAAVTVACLVQSTLAPHSVVIAADGHALQDAPSDDHSESKQPVLKVTLCDDFDVTEVGVSQKWQQFTETKLNRRPKGQLEYESSIRMMYSSTGVYVLFSGTDRKITATMTEDFADLWNEDVFECFFWTNEKHPVYFEYEISPLGYELPILVPKLDGKFLGWRPWHYEGKRRIQKEVVITGGPQQSGAEIKQWQAEVFIPYELLQPLTNVPPQKGTRWRANFYRVDYDDSGTTAWDWARVGSSFHDIENFGTLIFE
ncbi:MAG: carbohydrate-binding family 9-like protein [Planctomyces sp.]|nr:carbohydrate-binding family 9-like protein [Planctomyces sp.]